MTELFKEYYEMHCNKKRNEIKKNRRADSFLKLFSFSVLLTPLFIIFLPNILFSLIPFIFALASLVDYKFSFKKGDCAKEYFKEYFKIFFNKTRKDFRIKESKIIEMQKVFNNEENLAKVYKEKNKLTKQEMSFFIEEYKRLPKENIETIIERRFIEVEKNSINITNE